MPRKCHRSQVSYRLPLRASANRAVTYIMWLAPSSRRRKKILRSVTFYRGVESCIDFPLLRCLKPPLFMSKISQSVHQATSGKETDSLADASSALPRLRKAGSAAASSSVSKAPKAKGSELSTTRERTLRCAAHTCFVLRQMGAKRLAWQTNRTVAQRASSGNVSWWFLRTFYGPGQAVGVGVGV